jgi:hypothetical protein
VSLYNLKTADKPAVYRISGAVKVGAIWGSDENGFFLRFEVIEMVIIGFTPNWSLSAVGITAIISAKAQG